MKSSRGDQPTADAEERASEDIDLRARAEHLRAVLRNSWIVFLGNASGGAALASGLWPVASRARLSVWLAVLILLNLTRWLIGRQLARKPLEVTEVRRHEGLFLLGTLASGLIWGSAALLFHLPGQPDHSMFLALVLVAMTAASPALLSFHRYAYLIFCTPVLVPLALQLGLEQGSPHTVVALAIPIYYSLLFILSRQIYQFTHEAIVTSLTRQRDALVDQLTAIPNRRAFEEFLEREWVRGIRSGRPLTLIVSDIDGFKTYNDQYGHAVGDAILRSVASLFLRAARRRTDLAARIGGDEFAIIAPETERMGVSRILEGIERNRAQLARGTFEAWEFPTLSFGFCTIQPSDSGSVFELFEAADAALYQAKLGGRNRASGCVIQ